MSTYQRRERQAKSWAQSDLSTGNDAKLEGTLRGDMIAQKASWSTKRKSDWGKESINDKGRPSTGAIDKTGKRVPLKENPMPWAPNLRRESIEIKKAASRKKK